MPFFVFEPEPVAQLRGLVFPAGQPVEVNDQGTIDKLRKLTSRFKETSLKELNAYSPPKPVTKKRRGRPPKTEPHGSDNESVTAGQGSP